MSLKILLADDNMTAQRMGSKILTDAGYQVVAVSNGAAAIKKIASEKPELLILDVYMPGYTGLEVCEKVKNDPTTAQVPVILTVTNMEPFNPADGNRVRSDGVMIKPFEATDLLAVVQKFEAKSAKAAPAEYTETQKIAPLEEFKDASYEEWKAEAPEEAEPQKIEMSAEVAAAPAMGFDEPMGESAPSSGFVVESAPAFEGAAADFGGQSAATAAAAFVMEGSAAPAFEASPAFEMTPSTEPLPSLEAAAAIAPPAEFEATIAAPVGDIPITQAAELEVQSSAGDAVVAQDPALVTNADEMAQFVTGIGVENPEDIPVGIAMPGLTDPADVPTEEIPALEEPAANDDFIPRPPDLGYMATMKMPALVEVPPTAPEPVAEAPVEAAVEPPVEEHRPRTTAEMDMQHAVAAGTFAAAAPAPALEQEAVPEHEAIPEPPPAHPAAPEATIPDHLVAQFQAELDQAHQDRATAGETEPAPVDDGPVTESIMAAAAEIPASQLDEERIAAAVNRALEKYKEGLRAELIQAIVRELKG